MKNLVVLIGLVCFCSCSSKYQDMSNESQDYHIIPQPEHLSMQQGRFLINSATKIIA